jgi:hypothetical protein
LKKGVQILEINFRINGGLPGKAVGTQNIKERWMYRGGNSVPGRTSARLFRLGQSFFAFQPTLCGSFMVLGYCIHIRGSTTRHAILNAHSKCPFQMPIPKRAEQSTDACFAKATGIRPPFLSHKQPLLAHNAFLIHLSHLYAINRCVCVCVCVFLDFSEGLCLWPSFPCNAH